MKNWSGYIRLVIACILFILVFSCKKEPDCYECTTTFDITYKYEATFERFSTSDTQKFCEMSQEEATDYEASNTGTYTEENSGFITITVRTTKCIK